MNVGQIALLGCHLGIINAVTVFALLPPDDAGIALDTSPTDETLKKLADTLEDLETRLRTSPPVMPRRPPTGPHPAEAVADAADARLHELLTSIDRLGDALSVAAGTAPSLKERGRALDHRTA